jgi:hypothetical protein
VQANTIKLIKYNTFFFAVIFFRTIFLLCKIGNLRRRRDSKGLPFFTKTSFYSWPLHFYLIQLSVLKSYILNFHRNNRPRWKSIP